MTGMLVAVASWVQTRGCRLDVSGTHRYQVGQLVALEVRDVLRPLTSGPPPVARLLQVFATASPCAGDAP